MVFDRVSSGGATGYLSFTSLSKCKITRDTIGDAFTSPISYIVFGV